MAPEREGDNAVGGADEPTPTRPLPFQVRTASFPFSPRHPSEEGIWRWAIERRARDGASPTRTSKVLTFAALTSNLQVQTLAKDRRGHPERRLILSLHAGCIQIQRLSVLFSLE